MRNIFTKILSTLSRFNSRVTGVQGTLFLIFAFFALFGTSDRFWMFMIGSIVFTALQAIIDELRKLNNK